jgi:L,D-transpeptidase ErfK/SrfK
VLHGRKIAAWLLSLWCAFAAIGPARRAAAREWDEQDFWRNPPKVYNFTPPGKVPLDQVQTVIGQNRTVMPEKGDTFLDLARYYDIGFNEIFDANPGSDEWIPAQIGKPLVISQEFVLPSSPYTGIVINIPEMRLYYYPPAKGGPQTVITFPVGLGREDWKTPVGHFSIREKNVNPTWVIPESIRKERVEDKGFSETMIPGGSPDNPLGKYRMRLTLNLYGIHGTNIPWGVGMLVSHGCVRLYPEDIEHFYPMVPVGTQGEFVYQTVKVGTRDGRVFVEVHKDLYGTQPGPYREAVGALQRMGLLNRVDDRKLMQVVSEQSGVPMDVTRSGGAPAPAEPQQAMPAPAARPPTQSQPAPRPPGATVPPTSAAHRAAPAAQPKPVAARTRNSTQARSTAE